MQNRSMKNNCCGDAQWKQICYERSPQQIICILNLWRSETLFVLITFYKEFVLMWLVVSCFEFRVSEPKHIIYCDISIGDCTLYNK